MAFKDHSCKHESRAFSAVAKRAKDHLHDTHSLTKNGLVGELRHSSSKMLGEVLDFEKGRLFLVYCISRQCCL